jgi:hypothetical protein
MSPEIIAIKERKKLADAEGEVPKPVPPRRAECYRSPYYRRFSEMSALKTRLSKADCR